MKGQETNNTTIKQHYRVVPIINMTPRRKRRSKQNDKATTTVATQETQENRVEYSAKMIISAMNQATRYLRDKANVNSCLNTDNRPTGNCACVFQIMGMERKRGEKKIFFFLAAEEIAMWFNSTLEVERELIGKQDTATFLLNKYQNCVGVQPLCNGKSYTKRLYFNCLPGCQRPKAAGKLMGHDWDVGESEERLEFPTTMCVPTALLVWQMLVGGDNWKNKKFEAITNWHLKQYPRIFVDAGKIAELVERQKLQQRLFYARVDDYMSASPSAQRIKLDKTVVRFIEMDWVQDKELAEEEGHELLRSRLRHNWDMWRFKSIHFVMAGTNMGYSQATRNLVDALNVKVENIEPENVDFLNELFSLIAKQNRNKFDKVARDKKLFFLPFHSCHNIQRALEVYYAGPGNGSLRGNLKKFTEQTTYKERLEAVDKDIGDKLLSMLGDGKQDVAFQTSLLVTKTHCPQEAHVDYDTKTDKPQKYMIAFLPLTDTGQFLQFWKKKENDDTGETTAGHGEIVFIPRGQLVLVPGETIHGGGFRADHRTDGAHGHMRLHFYVYPGSKECMFGIKEHKNDYVSKAKKQYRSHPELENTGRTLNNTFFHGY
jgi:hypothetical protein